MKSFFTTVSALTSTLSLLSVSQAAPLSNGSSCGIPGRTDESSYFSVVGVQGAGVHPRRELRDLEKDAKAWNIFLQAFARFQGMDQNDKVSYFKVAGIHGAPFGEWDGVKGDGLKGYCPHNTNLFISWHRPYLALFEQILHDRAVDIANEYPAGEARDNARKVADTIRLPYWDWAMNPPKSDEGVMPESLRRQTVSITYPNGTKGQIRNPLLQYNFHPMKYDFFSALSEFQFKNWNTTIRSPLDGYSANATSRNDESNSRITTAQPNNRDTLYKLLTVHQPWNQWSTKANGGTIGSVETLHDGVHNTFGLGNMGIVEMSAFDPVFWFHHCQMDRLAAIYQYRYTDTWVEDAVQPAGTYTVAAGSTQGAQAPLTPFHMNAKGDMWTSDLSRNWTSFGYTYPELASNPTNETLTEAINKLYKAPTQGLVGNGTITNPTPGANNETAFAMDWLAKVNMPADIKTSYSVRCFLGEPDADPKKWATDPNYVGQIGTLSSPRMSSDTIVTGSVELTDKLAAKYKSGELKSLDKARVEEWLKTNFHWRIQALDYSEIPRSKPPKGLNVTVFNVPVELPKNNAEVPKWTGPIEEKPDIKGNPPSSSAPTVPVPGNGDKTGGFNETSGEWVWDEAKGGSSNAPAKPSATPISISSSAAPIPSATPSPSSAAIASPSQSSSPASSAAPSSASSKPPPVTQAPSSSSAPEAPEPSKSVVIETLPNGEEVTKIVTVVVPVTIYVPAPTDA
ncbi:Di-copper centre-containing protein [Periconia macrospinosa]|uniref:tyrosinase n=1 Tax=Periconia macrospinosa TaxID=97972 RepID=A0A2V1DTY0_9PLEO|nr:Di-copper centre-containing protein [Periconia macrospinosa]